jgi:hypothetical protein
MLPASLLKSKVNPTTSPHRYQRDHSSEQSDRDQRISPIRESLVQRRFDNMDELEDEQPPEERRQ